MDDILIARSLFGTTMGFHIINATIGVGLPLMILAAELLYQRTMASLIIGGIFSVLTAVNGHSAAQYLHEYQPEKLAGAEGLFETQKYAPLAIGGFTDRETESVKWGIEIPWALSFLAGNSFDTEVKGLNDFPEEHWPPLFIHTLFNVMVGVGMLLITLSMIAYAWNKLLKKEKFPRFLMWLFVASGPLAMIGIEFGWIFACTGRQPWNIYHVLTTEDSATTATNLGILFVLFAAVYVLLGVMEIIVLRYYFRKNTVADDLNRAQQKEIPLYGSNT